MWVYLIYYLIVKGGPFVFLHIDKYKPIIADYIEIIRRCGAILSPFGGPVGCLAYLLYNRFASPHGRK